MPPTNTKRSTPNRLFGELAQLSENLSQPAENENPKAAETPAAPSANGTNPTLAFSYEQVKSVAGAAPAAVTKAALERSAECDPPTADGHFSLLDAHCAREYREQFRLLRTQLMLHRSRFTPETDFKVVCVMSTHKGEGKSFTASNLAAVLAASGERVLLIDADPRSKPTSIGMSLSEDSGLPSALAAPMDWLKDVHRVKGTSLYVMARGPQKASYGLRPAPPARSSRELNLAPLPALLEIVRPHFDWVIVDGAAFAVCPDAPWLTSVTDGSLLVISENMSRFSAVQESLASIPPQRFVGIVFNKRARKSKIKVRLRIRLSWDKG